MTPEQIEALHLVGDHVLVERKMVPKTSAILLPDGTNTPDLYTIHDKVLKYSPSAQKLLQEEKELELPPNPKPIFAAHMQPVAYVTQMKNEDKSESAFIIVNYRHIVGYDLSS
jgi:hypothetical protein